MRKPGVLPVEIDAEVAFHDVDLARIAWHGHHLKYLENARWALMDSVGYGLEVMLAAHEGWPIIDLRVSYLRAARYRDRLRVRAAFRAWDGALTINYLITDARTGERVARAQTRQVAVDMKSGQMHFALPAAFIERLEAALAQATDLTPAAAPSPSPSPEAGLGGAAR
jgi:acyl-CoA thioester hydrolase